jgi:quercetin dioxygenase-like cupin family protein
MHRHVNAQLCEVRAGALRFFYEDGKQELIKAGECLFLAPDVPHEARAEEDSIVVDVFTPERADWAAGDDAYLRHK